MGSAVQRIATSACTRSHRWGKKPTPGYTEARRITKVSRLRLVRKLPSADSRQECRDGLQHLLAKHLRVRPASKVVCPRALAL